MKKIIETKVGVIGFGYVGKPLAYLAADIVFYVIVLHVKIISYITKKNLFPTQYNS